MKKILITAGGTATAWHITEMANKYFKNDIEIQVCDTNRPELVPAIVSAKKVHTVPPVVDNCYTNTISNIIENESIDCIVPLIPQEAYLFARDSEFVKQRNIISSAPLLETTDLLADKEKLCKTLESISIPTPKIFSKAEIEMDKEYMIKPRLGFGSLGIYVEKGKDITTINDDVVIQEYCKSDDYDEVTVEVYNGKNELHIFSRRRIATKAGVCVKMEPVDNGSFLPYIKKLVKNVKCPIAFNVQFLRDNGEWKLFDCNLRLGAGTALSSAVGFQLTRAFLAELIDSYVDSKWFEYDSEVKTVLRVYKEVVVK